MAKPNAGAVKASKGRTPAFASIARKAFGRQRGPGCRTAPPFPKALATDPQAPNPYVKQLKDALVKTGKPLNRSFILKKHLPLIAAFLKAGGFSTRQVQRVMAELRSLCPSEKLPLSRFFKVIEDLEKEKAESAPADILHAGAAPYLETALRQLGYTPADISHAMAAAKVDGGGVDPQRLLHKLAKAPMPDAPNLTKASRQANAEAAVQNVLEMARQSDLSTKRVQLLAAALAERTGRLSAKPAAASTVNTASPLRPGGQADNAQDQTVKSAMEDLLAHVQSDAEGTKKTAGNGDFARTRLSPLGLDTTHGPSVKAPKNAAEPAEAHVTAPVPDAGLRGPFAGKPSVSSGTTDPAGARTAAPVPDNNVPAYVVDQVGRQLSKAILAGDRTVELKLKPPELGSLKVQLETHGSGLKLGVTAENQTVKELLQSQLHELKDILAGRGIKVDRLDVDIQQPSEQSMSQPGNSSESRQWRSHAPWRTHGPADDEPSPVVEESATGEPSKIRQRLLDLTA